MKQLIITVFLSLGVANLATAQSDLLIPQSGLEEDVPGAAELPDPNRMYRVVFDIVAGVDDAADVNPRLAAVGQFLNTLDKHGVPAENRDIAIVIHRDATEVVIDDATYRERNGADANPNIPLLQSLSAAGVDIRQCGQAFVNKGIDPAAILPEVQLDYWALTTLLKFQQEGFIKVGG